MTRNCVTHLDKFGLPWVTIFVIFLSSFNSICRNGDESFEAEHQAFFPSCLAKEAIVFLFKLEDAVIFLSGTFFPRSLRSEKQAPLKVKIIIKSVRVWRLQWNDFYDSSEAIFINTLTLSSLRRKVFMKEK